MQHRKRSRGGGTHCKCTLFYQTTARWLRYHGDGRWGKSFPGTAAASGDRRAAVADPPVLILDEATSSVDTRTRRTDRKRHGSADGRKDRVCYRTSIKYRAKCQCDHGTGAGEDRRERDHAELLEQRGKYYQLYHGMFELS